MSEREAGSLSRTLSRSQSKDIIILQRNPVENDKSENKHWKESMIQCKHRNSFYFAEEQRKSLLQIEAAKRTRMSQCQATLNANK